MQPHDYQFFTQLAGTAWLVVFLIFLFLGALAVLVPFFVWRIWKWSHATFEEVAKLNAQMGRLIILTERASRPVRKPLPATGPTAGAEEMFTFEPETKETAPAVAPSVSPETGEGAAAPAGAEGLTPQGVEETAPPPEEELEEQGDWPPFPEFEEEKGPAAPAEAEEPPPRRIEETATPEEELEDQGDWPPFPEFGEEEEAAAPAEAEESLPQGIGETAAAEETREEPEEAPAPTVSGEEPREEITPAAPAEEKEAAIQLPDDPQRPDSHLARCGSCGHKLAYKKKLSGKRVRCPSCKEPLELP